MAAAKSETDWNKLTVVQLKGALARRGLSGDGQKAELVERLQEHDKENTKEEDEPTEKMEEEIGPQVFEPFLTKNAFNSGYQAVMALKTVCIKPFSRDMLQHAGLVTWLEECRSYSILKSAKDTNAELVFPTIEKGDAAFADLKTNLTASEVSHPPISNPGANPWGDDGLSMNQESSATKAVRTGNFMGRLLILEGLAENLNTEEKLIEFFPEAVNVVSFQFNKDSEGIAVLEFETVSAADAYLESVGKTIKMEEVDIKVAKWFSLIAEFAQRNKTKLQATTEKVEKNASVELADEERIELNKELNQLYETVTNIFSSDTVFSHDKLAKYIESNEKFTQLRTKFFSDTRRRLKEKKDIPEPEDEMLPNIKSLVEKEAKDKEESKPAEDQEKVLNELEELDTAVDQIKHESNKLMQRIRYQEKLLNPEKSKQRREILDAKQKREWKRSRGQRGEVPRFSGRGGRGPLRTSMYSTLRRGVNGAASRPDRNVRAGLRGRGTAARGAARTGRNLNSSRDEGEWRSMTSSNNTAAGGRNRRRAGRDDGDDSVPPTKRGRDNRRDRNESYSRYDDTAYGMRADRSRSGARGEGRDRDLIENITSALSTKMAQLEQLQASTLQTQMQMMGSAAPVYGGANAGYGDAGMAGGGSYSDLGYSGGATGYGGSNLDTRDSYGGSSANYGGSSGGGGGAYRDSYKGGRRNNSGGAGGRNTGRKQGGGGQGFKRGGRRR